MTYLISLNPQEIPDIWKSQFGVLYEKYKQLVIFHSNFLLDFQLNLSQRKKNINQGKVSIFLSDSILYTSCVQKN